MDFNIAAVRLEGGIGDHILGMRILPFVREKYPDLPIVVFSDAAGGVAQQELVRLSPLVAEVIPVHQAEDSVTLETMGRFDRLLPADRDRMKAARIFFDAWGAGFFISASQLLGVDFYRILAGRTELRIPEEAREEAERLAPSGDGRIYAGLSLSKYGIEHLRTSAAPIEKFLAQLLQDPRVTILNFYATQFSFAHWPDEHRLARERLLRDESKFLRELSARNERIVAMRDVPIPVLTALLARCAYFIGVDNGIKHIAWALNVPLTYFMPEPPQGNFILRWLPDYHRMLQFSCSQEALAAHINCAVNQLSARA